MISKAYGNYIEYYRHVRTLRFYHIWWNKTNGWVSWRTSNYVRPVFFVCDYLHGVITCTAQPACVKSQS